MADGSSKSPYQYLVAYCFGIKGVAIFALIAHLIWDVCIQELQIASLNLVVLFWLMVADK